jgi:tetratricopeptide (TPR) repeat protein
MGGSAAAGLTTSAMVAGAVTPPVGVAILGTLALFAGGAAVYQGAKAKQADKTTDEILQRLTKLTHEHRSLSRALALLPEDIGGGSKEIAERIRTLRTAFADDDPAVVADRVQGVPDLAAFLEAQTEEREAMDDQFRQGLSVLIDEAIAQGRFRAEAIAALTGLDAKLDAVQGGISEVRRTQLTDSKNIARIRELLEQPHLTDEQLKDQLRAEIEAEYADKLAQERDAREVAERAAEAVMDVRHVEGIETALREHGGQAIVDALLALPTPTEETRVSIHRKVAEWAYLIGNIEQAERSIGVLLAIDSEDLDAINRLGLVQLHLGRFDDAEAGFQKVLDLASDDIGWQAVAAGNIGMVRLERWDFTRLDFIGALDGLLMALQLNERIGSVSGTAKAYGNLALVHQRLDDLPKAQVMLRKALALFKKKSLEQEVARTYANLGAVLKARGKPRAARVVLCKAANTAQAISNTAVLAGAYANLGALFEEAGDFAEARRLWTLARDLYAQIGAGPNMERVKGWLDGLPLD